MTMLILTLTLQSHYVWTCGVEFMKLNLGRSDDMGHLSTHLVGDDDDANKMVITIKVNGVHWGRKHATYCQVPRGVVMLDRLGKWVVQACPMCIW